MIIARLRPTLLLLPLALLSTANPVRSAPGEPRFVLQPRGVNDCSPGLVYDDGSFENTYTAAGAAPVDLVMRFDVASPPRRLQRLCLCWTRRGGDDSVDFDLLVYRADGAGGQPGTVRAGLGGLRAVNVPLFPQTAFYSFDLAPLGIDLDADRFFIGPSWDSTEDPEVYQCGDENGPTSRPLFYSTNEGASWNPLGVLFGEAQTIGVRAVVGTGGGGFSCVPDADTLCLNQGRFQVRLQWRNFSGETAAAKAVSVGTDDSGLFYFVNPSNWEFLVKVINACSLGGRYWVFVAATTTVEYTLTVTDSQTGASKQYRNTAGTPAPTVTDTGAFSTCP